MSRERETDRGPAIWTWADEAQDISPAQIRSLMAKPAPVFDTAYFRGSGKTGPGIAKVMCEQYLDWLPMGDKVPASPAELRTWVLSRALERK